jgi:PAS domain S-box-containing protein
MLPQQKGEMTQRDGDDGAALSALVEGAPGGLLLLSPTGVILKANEAAAQLLGVGKDALVERHLDKVMARTGWEPSFLAQALSTGGTVSRTCDLGDGRKALVSARTSNVPGGGGPFVAVSISDVTGINLLVSRLDQSAPAADNRWSQLRRAGGPGDELGRVIAQSSALRAVKGNALAFARVDSPVLIVGETGTGKNLIARMIHQASKRAAMPLREVNCGAIPGGLMESELFGYARGAFTGADARGKVGLVELAHKGTLLLDEIGDLPHTLQVKLLSFLEDGEIWPVGAGKSRRLDVRVIAATNANLTEMVAQGAFRKDLFYRLNVLVIHVPPLRERADDIPPLVDMMLRSLQNKLGKRVQLSSDALALLGHYPFPGNVRELWNLVERLVVCAKGEVVDVPDIPVDVAEAALADGGPAAGAPLKQMLRKVEAGIVREALTRYGTQSRAAKHLGVGQATIARKARLYDIGDALGRQSIPD